MILTAVKGTVNPTHLSILGSTWNLNPTIIEGLKIRPQEFEIDHSCHPCI
jgi:hypothetical protein